MKGSYLIEKNSTINDQQFALVPRSKGKRQRNRFPENCVHIHPTAEEAIHAMQPEHNLYPALVYGPCRSSEGCNLYYLIEWLEY